MTATKIFIIIPTYNEANNAPALIKKIFSLDIEGLGVIVVDDNSPDGTGRELEKLRQQYPLLRVIHRQEKSGLGRAYVAGFHQALELGADLICEMDADWSHNPKYLPTLITAANSHDLVLGSRYVKGGEIRNWNALRRLVSKLGNIYARTVLGVPLKDLTGGFKCYRRRVLEEINLATLSSVGYNFQIETTYKTYKKGFSIIEVPIVFTERKTGKSKFNFSIMIESFWKVLKLRLKK